MSLTVVFRGTALYNLARLRGEDKDVFVRARYVIASLADEPYPAGAVRGARLAFTGCTQERFESSTK